MRRRVASQVALCVATTAALALPAHTSAVAAGSPTVHLSTDSARPGQVVTVTGTAPGCAFQPFQGEQIYSDAQLQRVSSMGPNGAADVGGSFRTTVTVPPKAARSDILLPYGWPNYDTVVLKFPGCGLTVSANINVLPINRKAHITPSTYSPRTGTRLNVRVTDCLGGYTYGFTRLIDNTGYIFPLVQTSYDGVTLVATVNLAEGRRGAYSSVHAANPSNPPGSLDTSLSVACAQSEAPDSAAAVDLSSNETMVIDLTICPAHGSCNAPLHYNYDPPPPAAANTPITATTTVPAAAPAQPVTGQPTFVG